MDAEDLGDEATGGVPFVLRAKVIGESSKLSSKEFSFILTSESREV